MDTAYQRNVDGASCTAENVDSRCPQHIGWHVLQDAGLENMALEVGTVQGGQIAALQDGKDGALGKPGPPQKSGAC